LKRISFVYGLILTQKAGLREVETTGAFNQLAMPPDYGLLNPGTQLKK
jgi:hypothetical protein